MVKGNVGGGGEREDRTQGKACRSAGKGGESCARKRGKECEDDNNSQRKFQEECISCFRLKS